MTSQDPSLSSVQPVTLAIGGMSCGHCVAAVREALEEVPGVTVQQVSIGSATIALDPATGSPRALTEAAVEAVADAGYEASIGVREP
jgi:copper chaperone